MKPFICAPAIALLLSLGAQLAHAQTQPSAAPAPAADPRFDINKFIVRGATLIPADGMKLLLAPYIGKSKDFGDVQKALEALEKAYTSKGYSAVQVVLPEQQIDVGEVEFDVVEAKIGKIVIEGNKYFDEANVRASLPQVRQGQPPNIFHIADNLRLANENPAKQTTVLLRSGAEEGQVDAVVRIADERPNKLSVTLDNTGTQQTGVFRVGVGYQNSNLWNRDHVLNAQYVSAPNDDDRTGRLGLYPSKHVFIVGAQYRVPLYRRGDTLEFSAGYSNVNSGVVANLFNISGSGSIFGARYNQNLEKIGDLEHKLSYALDWRGYQSVVTQIGVAGAGLVPDVTVHPISLTYAGTYRKSESDTNFSLSASQNLPGGNDGGTGAFQGDPLVTPARPAARAGANPRYFMTRWSFNHNRALPRDWQFRWGMSGQLTRDTLIAGEQFGIGGADSVRGFLEREIVNDYGYRGTLEFYSPDFGSIVPLVGARMRALAFYDWGAVRRISPTVLEIHGQHVSSAGFGVRFSRGTNVSFRLDVATVTDSGGLQKIGDVRVHANFAYIF
ncbi:MAG: ShlB/FhaC/HecB family hemolysin secretion/activation protein [Betaproteobacteria bacterium]|nr:ShlB/FhaC/HecB family hemolysin secretion/activation protein [Betaproteobacteria bacterium]